MGILERIDSPADLRDLKTEELPKLAQEIRARIIDVTSKRGGHVAPNLGVVELTLALHYVFDTPKDRLIFDVGHQAYSHKLITGRREQFHTLRTYGGISGFPRCTESQYDAFGTGHSSTSLSAGLGMAVARDLSGDSYRVIAVIGDGSLVAGMSLEALNNAGHLKSDLIVVLNDNEMSIAESRGAIASYLNRIITTGVYNRVREDVWNLLGVLPDRLSRRARTLARKIQEGLKNFVIPGLLFEELGFRYIGPLDGHNFGELIPTFRRIRHMKGPVLVHVITKKGKGFEPAERESENFHGIGPFDAETGKPLKVNGPPSFTSIFGDVLVELARKDERIVAVTAGMCLGTGLVQFRKEFQGRFFDVGICEQHAVTFAAALALSGLKPVVAIYSTFLQRAYDQIIHDVCLQALPVVFAIDRAGLVGEDGPTHHGTFDISYLRTIPNLVIMAPRDEGELRFMVYTALNYEKGPIALRYPRSQGVGAELSKRLTKIPIGRGEVLREGDSGCIIAIGSCVWPALRTAERIEADNGICVSVINARFVKPLDPEFFLPLGRQFKKIWTVEEGSLAGGFGSAVMELFETYGVKTDLRRIGIPDQFIAHGSRSILLKKTGLAEEEMVKQIAQEYA